MKISVRSTSLRGKLDDMGKDHDLQVIQWKTDVEEKLQLVTATEFLASYFEPTTEGRETSNMGNLRHYMELQSEMDAYQMNKTTTTNTVPDDDTLQNIINETPREVSKEIVLSILNKIISYATSHHLSDNTTVVEVISKISEIDPYVLYQIIGDNLDLMINVRQKSSQNKNKSFHWFHTYAIKDIVSGNHLSNKHTRRLIDVPIREFLPSIEQTNELKANFTLLIAKIIVKRIPALKFLSKSVLWHIPHQYSKEMAEKTSEVNIQTLNKNPK